jgi:hypothetical protein
MEARNTAGNAGSSVAIVDVLPTDGFIACGMIKAPDGMSVVLASSGGVGHDLQAGHDERSASGSRHARGCRLAQLNMTPDRTLGFGTSPPSDEVVVIDFTTHPVTNKGTLDLTPLPGDGANQPDALGGGDPVVDGVLPVSLRAAGQLALVDVASLGTRSYVPIAPPAEFNPATCVGCAVHGVSVRGSRSISGQSLLQQTSGTCSTIVQDKVTLTAANGDQVFVRNSGQDCVDSMGRITGSGTYTITGGSGRFMGASGTGTFSVTAQVTSISGNTRSGTFNPLTFDGAISVPCNQ